MKKINIPIQKQEDLCEAFGELKYKELILERGLNYKDIIEDIESLYEEEEEKIKTDVEYKEYLNKIYKQRLSNKSYPSLYSYYSNIRNSQDYCPYCNFKSREIKQLDHYLPESKFPSLSIVIKNLVPICKDCNERKSNYYSSNKSKQLIHPYYDEKLESEFNFIDCEIVNENQVGFSFKIVKLDSWENEFFEKVRFHFNKLEIDKLYLVDINSDFDIIFGEMKELYDETGSREEVKKYLRRKVNSYYKSGDMPWRYSTYKKILDSEWFFEKNFP